MIDEYLKAWLIKANNDLKAAVKLFESGENEEILTDVICFHCQQSIEKYLKAFLIKNKIEFKKSHNLDYILQLCINFDEDFKKFDLNELQNFAVEIRYPDEFYIPTFDETEKSVETAKKIKMFILSKLNVNENDLKEKEI